MDQDTVEYSSKELSLIKYFGFDEIKDNIQPPVMYRLMVEKAFINNDQSTYSQSLRRCVLAFNACSVYRMTPEWDDLIVLD